MDKQIFNVRKYGAKGDGKTKDTRFIQNAIDDCNRNGGGRVYFPTGSYLSGTLHLKSNVIVYLDSGATLLGSPDKDDYEGSEKQSSHIGNGYFITGSDLDAVAIEGYGVIDGQGPTFWSTSEMLNQIVLRPKEFRPRSLIYLVKCRNVKIRDVTIKNSPCFTLWLLGCDRVNIDGIVILNPRNGPNTDGIDIDCSRNVHIANCHIDAGDDCIALKSDGNRLGNNNHPCENVTVTNCTLTTIGCGVRIGYEGDAAIKNCVFSNLVIYNANIGINALSILVSELLVPEVKITKGATIENIAFSNIVMNDVNRPIYLWLGKEVPGNFITGKIENILISNVIATARNGSYIGGIPENLIKNIELNGVRQIMKGRLAEDSVKEKDGVWGRGVQPYAFFFQYIDGLKVREVQVDWEDAEGDWENAIRGENVRNIEIDRFSGRQGGRKSKIPAIHLSDVERAFIHGCCASVGTDIFLGLSGKTSRNITVVDNELSAAKKVFQLDRNIKKAELFTGEKK